MLNAEEQLPRGNNWPPKPQTSNRPLEAAYRLSAGPFGKWNYGKSVVGGQLVASACGGPNKLALRVGAVQFSAFEP